MAGEVRFNGVYEGGRLNHVAFPLGGIGAGMVCLEGTGALSHVSLRHVPDVFNEPYLYSALCVKGEGGNVARVLEGPAPKRKHFGAPGTGNGSHGRTHGLPRFESCSFLARFPFGTVELHAKDIPLKASLTGWSPFVPGDADASSLPVAALEYSFENVSGREVEAVYSFNAKNLMAVSGAKGVAQVSRAGDGLVFSQAGGDETPWEEGSFHVRIDAPGVQVNPAWFRGGWFDPGTMAWNDVAAGRCVDAPELRDGFGPSPGGSLALPFRLAPGETRTINVLCCWHVPKTKLRVGEPSGQCACGGKACGDQPTHAPWYAGRFPDILALAGHWSGHYAELRRKSAKFRDCFHDTTLPPEVVEAVAANLTILKSPTVLRQADGRLWGWEGCCDCNGCCHGSCTHVWNYAQALPHLFPGLERGLRETEFDECQDERGHQNFRAWLPIRPTDHKNHAAADGQLGGIMKAHREWRVSGDDAWLGKLWPKVAASLDYCAATWDPRGRGVLEEPHHNTYDIEFWGPDGMCSSFYLGALKAAVLMGTRLGQDVSRYQGLYAKGRRFLEEELFNGEYFAQKIQWKGLNSPDPTNAEALCKFAYSPEAKAILEREGPKYQYGSGCLSDGVLGAWMAEMCGVGEILDSAKVRSHLLAVHKYNLKLDLSAHANPQRPGYALGDEGGLLLCTWPKGDKLSLPFPYSDEVWTGIEYQVASHLMLMGEVEKGLEIVRVCRGRYDGSVRNPFNEYECGHWYARAMSSYGLLAGLTGCRYDAIDKVLRLRRAAGDFRVFLATATGYGSAGVEGGKPFLEVAAGRIDVKELVLE